MANFLISGIKKAVKNNKKALKVYVANCSTEVGETEHYTIDNHIEAFSKVIGPKLFTHCLVNKKVVKKTINDEKLGAVNNITTKKTMIDNVKIVLADVVSKKNPLYHDSDKLAKAIVELYNESGIKA